MNNSNIFAIVGVVIGCVSLAGLYIIEVYDLSPNSVSGTGQLYADGTVTYESNRSFLHSIPQIAFAAPFLSLIFGAISLMKKEKVTLSIGAFCFGFSPVMTYILGIFLTSMIFFGITFPVAGLYVFNKFKET